MLSDSYISLSDCSQIDGIRDFVKNPHNDENKRGRMSTPLYHRSKGDLYDIKIVETDQDLDINTNIRSAHAVSVYLLGYALKSIIDQDIDRFLNLYSINLEGEERFRYPWLLCSLYHDVFSDIENTEKGLRIIHTDFEGILLDLNIEYDIYDRIYSPGDKEVSLPHTYEKDTIAKYFAQKVMNSYGPDHGILSGYFLYDRLSKNFSKHKDKHRDETEWCESHLHWADYQARVFRFVADAIIAHNIWHDPHSNIDQLRANEKNDKHKLLSKELNPLAFYLSLIDTIEPYKYFEQYSKENLKHVFTDININYQNNIITISQSEKSYFDFKCWHCKKMSNMNMWLENVNAFYNQNTDKIYICLRKNQAENPSIRAI